MIEESKIIVKGGDERTGPLIHKSGVLTETLQLQQIKPRGRDAVERHTKYKVTTLEYLDHQKEASLRDDQPFFGQPPQ